ncbi:MAG TPA: DUF4388 domain-containing protein [Nitrospiria bacterium]
MNPPPDFLSGRLQADPLPDLLQRLQASQATGTLVLRNGWEEKSIYIKKGQIIFASSNQPQDRLGSVLVKNGKLTGEQVEAALKLQRATNQPLGGIIVELGFMTPKDLFEGFKLQVNEILFSLFCWVDGDYAFTGGDIPPGIIALVMDTAEMITQVISRLQEEPGSK